MSSSVRERLPLDLGRSPVSPVCARATRAAPWHGTPPGPRGDPSPENPQRLTAFDLLQAHGALLLRRGRALGSGERLGALPTQRLPDASGSCRDGRMAIPIIYLFINYYYYY